MARSPSDDHLYAEMQQHWIYRPDANENCPPTTINGQQQPMSPNTGILNENNIYVNQNTFSNSDVYMNKHPYNMNIQSGDNVVLKEDCFTFNNMQNVNHVNSIPNEVLNMGNGHLVRVFFDKNNRPYMIPVSNQYGHFNPPGLRETSMQAPQPAHMFPVNQEYSMNNNNNIRPPQQHVQVQNSSFNNDNMNHSKSNAKHGSNFLNEVLGNWEPNSSGTYSPFGQNYPLNYPEAPAMNIHHSNNPLLDAIASNINKQEVHSPKRNEANPLADTSNKKRIVAEVKPMRPTYSDVLAKNAKTNMQPEIMRKIKTSVNTESKTANKTNNNKSEKQLSGNNRQLNEEYKHKNEKKMQASTVSSGSESGDLTFEEVEKTQKQSKKNRNKHTNMSRKWSSLDNITNEEDSNYNRTDSGASQFVFIEDQSEKKKDKKFNDNKNKPDKNISLEDDFKTDENDDASSQFVFQDGQTEGMKVKRKKEGRNHGHKASKSLQDKKKTVQSKWKRNKPGYLGIAQNYLENWYVATWKALGWFLYLLSDICRMSAHLSFDL